MNSALNETLELDSAINDYKKYYFLNTYDEKEDEVIAFVYAAKIGELDELANVNIIYNNKYYHLTTDIQEFYDNDQYVYYEQGLLYIKALEKDLNSIEVNINEYKYTYTLEKTHVWNIFDEYACFVGLQRYENETNKQLKNRILFAMENPGNATEDGLKNSIVTELMSLIDIDKKDIEISKVTPENLMKPYKEYNTLLEMLSEINKDALKDKK